LAVKTGLLQAPRFSNQNCFAACYTIRQRKLLSGGSENSVAADPEIGSNGGVVWTFILFYFWVFTFSLP